MITILNLQSLGLLYIKILGLFIFAVEKRLRSFAVYEMTSGSLAKLISKPLISSFENIIPYVSEDGNFVILFDKASKIQFKQIILRK